MTLQRTPRFRPAALIGTACIALPAGAQTSPATTSEDLSAAIAADAARTAAATSGHDARGFFVGGSGDGSRLYINGLVQMRLDMNQRSNPPAGADEFESGFQNRRTQLIFSGSLTQPLSFRIQTEFKSDGSTTLNDAVVQYRFESRWALRLGQFKPPLLREELVGDLSQLAAERSVVNSAFTQARSQGIEVSRELEHWRLAAAFNDGLGTANADFTDAREADYGLTGRAEWLLNGDWKQFTDFSSWRGSESATMLGGAVHYQGGGDTGNTSDVDVLEYTLDASIEGDGWNAFAALIGRSRDEALASFDDFGFLLQGGVFVSPQTELFARYDLVLPDEDRGAQGDPMNTMSVGLSHYFFEKSHAAQLRFQLSWFLDPQSDSIAPTHTSTGLLADAEGDQVTAIFEVGLAF